MSRAHVAIFDVDSMQLRTCPQHAQRAIHREITELSQGYPPASFGYFTSQRRIA